MSATIRRIFDAQAFTPGRFRPDQVPPKQPDTLRATIAEHVIAKQIARLEAQRGEQQ